MRRTLLLVIAFIALSDLYAQTRLGLHFTKEELEIWKKRAVSGPYRVKGDAQLNSPGDWTRVVAEANEFLANPSADRWVGYTGTGCFPSGDTYEPKVKAVRMQSAAFVWLVTGNDKYLAPIKEELLWHAQQPLLAGHPVLLLAQHLLDVEVGVFVLGHADGGFQQGKLVVALDERGEILERRGGRKAKVHWPFWRRPPERVKRAGNRPWPGKVVAAGLSGAASAAA